MVGRIAAAIGLGVVLGCGVWFLLPVPSIPFVGVSQASRSELLAPSGLIRDRGLETSAGRTAHLLFVGDVMLDRNVAGRMKEAKDPEYPFRKLPAGWFDTYDYAVANVEGVVSTQRRSPDKGNVDFLFDPSVVGTMKTLGIDAVSQANNHALDQGSVGYADSVRRLRDGGLLVFGHQVDDGAISLATTTVNGLRIAFLGYNTTDNPLDRAQAEPIIEQSASSSDVVIAYLHWGIEYRDKPDAASIELSHWLIEHGVDIVIGGHPHWVRGFSSYKGKPIAWSLGNFIFDQDFSKQTQQGLGLGIMIRGEQVEFEPIPLDIIRSQPSLVTGQDRISRLEGLAAISDPELRDQVRAGKIAF